MACCYTFYFDCPVLSTFAGFQDIGSQVQLCSFKLEERTPFLLRNQTQGEGCLIKIVKSVTQ